MRSIRLTVAALAAAFALAGSAGQATAAVTVGQTFVPDQLCSSSTFLQTTSPLNSYTFPSQGVVTAWRTQGDAETGVVARLKVGRSAGGNDYSIVGQSPIQAITPNALNTFPDRIPVRAGDFLGMFIDATSPPTNCFRLASGFASASEPGDFQPGAPTTFSASAGGQFNVAATVEPDADGDGFGDETQDACTVDPLVQGACIVPDTEITGRPKDRTKRRKVIYEFSANVPDATFECSLDGPYEPCTSPRVYRRLSKGRHKFLVRAFDVRGLVDSTPAVDKFRVQRKKRKK